MKSWLKFIEEKKDHLIKKVPSLTDDEKKLVIAFFNKHNSLEKMIDWNNIKSLTMLDFQKVIDSQKSLKIAKGSAQLGKDYVELNSLDGFNKAYMPLTHNGAKYLASNKVNKDEGKWCISYREGDNYWFEYSALYYFIIYVTNEGKWALQYEIKNDKCVAIWNRLDIKLSANKSQEEFGQSVKELQLKNKSIINKYKDKLPKLFTPDEFGDINCADIGLTELNVDSKTSVVNFKCHSNELTSLKGGPKKVDGYYDVTKNKLKSLEGAPEKVGGFFFCSYNMLTSLKGGPKSVAEDYDCSINKLTSLDGGPKEVGGSFDCRENKIVSLKGSPKKVGGEFNCSDNKLTSLKDCPLYVEDEFDCSNNELTSLEGCPKEVGGSFFCDGNNKKFTVKEVKKFCKVGGDIVV